MYIIWNMFMTSRLPYSSSYVLHEKLNTCFTGLNGIHLYEILFAMKNFERCTVAMLGGSYSQHVTDNRSRLNQPQSVIIAAIARRHVLMSPPHKKYLYLSARCKGESLLTAWNSLLWLGVPFSWYQSVFDVWVITESLAHWPQQCLEKRYDHTPVGSWYPAHEPKPLPVHPNMSSYHTKK